MIKCELRINWDVDRVLIKMLIEGINLHSTAEAFTTRDPLLLL